MVEGPGAKSMWIDYFIEDEKGSPIACGRKQFSNWQQFQYFRAAVAKIGIVIPPAVYILTHNAPIPANLVTMDGS